MKAFEEKMNNSFCLPERCTNNKYAIFFAISDNYSFAAANVIMGLYKHSSALMHKCDILIYHNGITERNKRLLSSLHENTIYMEMTFPESWNELLQHKNTVQWGSFIVCKCFGFMLVNRYEKVLCLDADMCVLGDISEIFEIHEDMAWRKLLAWNTAEVFAPVLKNKDDIISVCSGGMIYFSKGLRKYQIGDTEILNAFKTIRDLAEGGNDERIISWIAYDKKVSVKEMDIKFWNTSLERITPETKLLHFINCANVSTKPWKNPAAYIYCEEWAENYRRWIDMGGEGLVKFTREDYYNLLAFDKLKKLAKQQKEIDKYKKEVSEWKSKYDRIRNSNSYKLTEPLRKIKKWFKKLLKF